MGYSKPQSRNHSPHALFIEILNNEECGQVYMEPQIKTPQHNKKQQSHHNPTPHNTPKIKSQHLNITTSQPIKNGTFFIHHLGPE